MSWNQYADSLIQASQGNTSQMQIIGYNSAQYIQNTDKAFAVTPQEVMPLIEAYKRKNFAQFHTHGPTLARSKYRFLREEGNCVLLKSKGVGAVTVAFMKTAAIVAFTPEGKQQGKTNEALSRICTYLMAQGFWHQILPHSSDNFLHTPNDDFLHSNSKLDYFENFTNILRHQWTSITKQTMFNHIHSLVIN